MGVAAEDAERGSPGSGKVLLIEDNPAYLRLVQELLAEAGMDGFDVEWCDTLQDGLDHLREEHVDLVLLDLLLPDNLGTDTLEVTLEHAGGTPIVVLTGIQDDNMAREALELGADDYLCKGRLDPDRLARSIREALSMEKIPTKGGTEAEAEGEIQGRRLVPDLAERLEAAASALDAADEHLDPLGPGDAAETVSRELDRCRVVAEGLRELEDALRDDDRRDQVSLDTVLDDALVRLSTNGHAGGRVTLDWSTPPTVQGDPLELTRLFELLISHMLDHGDKAGHVHVTAEREDTRWHLRLADEGLSPEGPDPLDAVFDTEPTEPSLPAGLARELCEALAADHGARLRAEPEGGGLAVALSLPSGAPPGVMGTKRRDSHRKTL